MTKLQGILICIPLYITWGLVMGASITAGLFVFHVAVVPLLFKYSKTFRRSLIFANFVQWPLGIDYEDPSARGINGVRNLSLEYQSKIDGCPIKIGIWHIVPTNVYDRLKGQFEADDAVELNRILDEELINSKTPVILYCHGNSNSRAATHRICLYKLFQKMGFHTIAFDYRGYGDSTNVNPSENGVVEDALSVYDWLCSTFQRAVKRPPIFVWGHSLGTGISSHMLGNLDTLSSTMLERITPLPLPQGLILEAPFNNLADEVAKHPLAKLIAWLPYYESSVVEPFRTSAEFTFKSDEYLSKVKKLPILILHAKDDVIVPFSVGYKLYKTVLHSRKKGGATIKLHAFDKRERLGHKDICLAQNLTEIVGDFVASQL